MPYLKDLSSYGIIDPSALHYGSILHFLGLINLIEGGVSVLLLCMMIIIKIYGFLNCNFSLLSMKKCNCYLIGCC